MKGLYKAVMAGLLLAGALQPAPLLAGPSPSPAPPPLRARAGTPRPIVPAPVEASAEARLILIVLDGTRWQDIFRGPDPRLLGDSRFANADLRQAVIDAWGTGADHGAALMPFFHGLPKQGGVLWGNRDAGQCMGLTNGLWFSYPGYNEILTGRADDAHITSNAKLPNPNLGLFEWLNARPGFAGKVRAYGTWDVFPAIFNAARSGVPVNPGLGSREPTDTLTMRLAFEAIREGQSRVLFIGLGDSDELAHAGEYDQVLTTLNRDDDFIGEVWRMVGSDPLWRGHTTLIVTTDHGRGEAPDGGIAAEGWREHGSARAYALDPSDYELKWPQGFAGSDSTWLAAIGPGIRPAPSDAPCLGQNRIAATALTALGFDWRAFDPAIGAPLPFARKP